MYIAQLYTQFAYNLRAIDVQNLTRGIKKSMHTMYISILEQNGTYIHTYHTYIQHAYIYTYIYTYSA